MVTIKLQYPIEFAGRKIEKLELRRAKTADMLNAQKGGKTDAEQELALFASLTETEPDAIKQLDFADYKKLQAAFQDFLS